MRQSTLLVKMDKTVDKTQSMILEIEKNHGLYDKADKDYKDIMKEKTYGKQLDRKSD